VNPTSITQPQDLSRTRDTHADQRVDPFLLPPDTPFRFGLLILAILSTSLFAYQMLFLVAHDDEFVETYLRCGPDPLVAQSAEASTAARAAAVLCRQGFDRSEARWMLAGVALLAVVSVGFLFAVPWLRSRRHTYVLVDDRETPEIATPLRDLAGRAGTPGVDFLLDPFDPRTSAFTFGRPGRRRVVLRGGLVTLLVTDRPAFEAIVLHELGHVRNRDIDQTYVSLTTFAAFVLVAVLPFAAVLRGGLPVWPMLWRFAVLTLIVYLLFAALLRSRERYADARTRQWTEGDALAGVLGRAGQHPRRLLAGLMALHPAPHTRAQALADPKPLFRLTFVDALAVGLVASLALPQLVFLVGLITGGSLASAAWAAIPVAPLVAGFLTVGIWRQRYLEAYAGAVRRRVWPLGVGLGIGVALGPTLSINATGDTYGSSLVQSLVWHLAWAAIVTVVVAPVASWMASGAAGTATRHAQHADVGSRRILVPCLVATGLVAWVTGYLLYRLYHVRLFAMTLPAGYDLSETGGHVLDMTRGLLDPSVLWSWPDIAAFAAVLCLPWVAAGIRRQSAMRAAAAGSLVLIALPSLVFLSVYYARELPLEERWPVAFSANMDLFWLFAAAPVICALAAGTAAAMLRQRSLAGATVAVGFAAGFAFALLALLRPARSCVAWISAIPFSNDASPTSRCPSFSTGSYLGDLLPYVLAGAFSATIIAAPSLAAAGRALRTHTARLSPVRRRVISGALVLVLLVAAVVCVRLAADRAVDRATAASAHQQPVDIGAEGLVKGTGYTVRLVPGWVDITQQVAPLNLSIDRVLTYTDADGAVLAQILIYHVQDSPGAREKVRGDNSLRPQESADIDGEAAVQWTTPDRPKELHVEVVTEHGPHQYVIELHGDPQEMGAWARQHFADLMRSWKWETN
jgi:Zn-dependent protease with chaperone function